MRICHVNYHADVGGAAIAAMRLHEALNKYSDVEGFFAVINDNHHTAVTPLVGDLKKRSLHIQQALLWRMYRIQRSNNYSGHTYNIFSNGLVKKILKFNPDIVHLHSIVGEMLSIKEIGQLCRLTRVVWTFHDAWPYTGTEQYHLPELKERYRSGYSRHNRSDKGIDLDRFYWLRKRRCWRNMNCWVISPSNYLGREIKESYLFKDYPMEVIHHGVDLKVFCPGSREQACRKFGVAESNRYFGFAAVDLTNRVKGGNALKNIVRSCRKYFPQHRILVAGSNLSPEISKLSGICYLGPIKPEDMPDFYRALDVFINPTRIESFGLTNLEAMACGVPVISTRGSAIEEVVKDRECGFLCDSGNEEELVDGLFYLQKNLESAARKARKRAETYFSDEEMARRHVELYRKVMSES